MRVITVDEDTGKRVYSRKEIATIVGCSTQTIRLWEDAGVIPAPVRDNNDYRYWVQDDIEKILEYARIPRKDRIKRK